MKCAAIVFWLALAVSVTPVRAEQITIIIDMEEGGFELLEGELIPDGDGWALKDARIQFLHGRVDGLPIESLLSKRLEQQAGAAAFEGAGSIPGTELMQSFATRVLACWVVDVGTEAAKVAVTLGIELDRKGRVVPDGVRLVRSTQGSTAAVQTAFQAARRAVLRCQGAEGYGLPPEKFDQWRQIEMVFNPDQMRLR